MTELLAQAGETVHVIAHRWDGAPSARQAFLDGRLVVHRVALDEQTRDSGQIGPADRNALVPHGLLASSFPAQAFSWQAALLAERLVETEGIDIIEAQEWEAPLYYFQLRRALNLGPLRRPPCVVHIHSPSERIFEANAWDTTVADYRPAIAQEEFSIDAADAVLCPSWFVADEVLARYKVRRSALTVIPYPRGNAPQIARAPSVWSTGSICHVGRLEPRKGVLEWAEAIASVASDYPDVTFDFVGGDTPVQVTGGPTVGKAMLARIPRQVRRRVRLHGTRDHAGVNEILAGACAAVVPSRWENFPYSCIESMSSGLPVIASPHGGMRELVREGVSGWLAPDATPDGLARTLRRALETPPDEKRRMGHAAADTVRQVCDNKTIVTRHLDMKGDLVRAQRPQIQVFARQATDGAQHPANRPGTVQTSSRIAIVVICADGRSLTEEARAAIHAQTESASGVYVVGSSLEPTAGEAGWSTVPLEGRTIDVAAIAAAEALASGEPGLSGLMFIDPRLVLDRVCLATCRALFERDPRCGLVSGWTHETTRNRVRIQSCPADPHLWQDDVVSPYVAARSGALLAAAQGPDRPVTLRQMFDRTVHAGFAGVTYPAILGAIGLPADDDLAVPSTIPYSLMATAVQRLHTPLLHWLRTCTPAARRAFVREGLRNPGRSARWLAGRAARAWRTQERRPENPTAERDINVSDGSTISVQRRSS
jgi:glycosyltransferase involved in cell wall biosynthesis